MAAAVGPHQSALFLLSPTLFLANRSPQYLAAVPMGPALGHRSVSLLTGSVRAA